MKSKGQVIKGEQSAAGTPGHLCPCVQQTPAPMRASAERVNSHLQASNHCSVVYVLGVNGFGVIL